MESDVSDEVHVHGYDLMKDVKAGGTVEFDFPASIEGVFEAERGQATDHRAGREPVSFFIPSPTRWWPGRISDPRLASPGRCRSS
ncbi:MAG: hypothetical protein U0R26_02725 [Solirubrobacterales bacterium]